ncbi:MAG: DUF6362 family protein [Hyphomicrobiaceae bacterium]
MNDWTPEKVEERMVEAVAVLRRLPPVRVGGYFSTWPKMMVEFSDLVGQTPEPMKLPPPSPAAISRMEATLEWMKWLEPADSKLVWMRAERHQWKAICWRFGLSRATANRKFDYALSLITWRLNGRRVPTRRSRRYVVERVRTVPRQP